MGTNIDGARNSDRVSSLRISDLKFKLYSLVATGKSNVWNSEHLPSHEQFLF